MPPAPATRAEFALADRPPSRREARKGVNLQVGLILGAGLVLVVALFLVTAASRQNRASGSGETEVPAAFEVPPEPLSQDLAATISALDAELARLDGAERLAVQREKIAVLYREGRLDLAAQEQLAVAEAAQSGEEWKRAGDLHYDWMTSIEDPQGKVQAALQAVDAYQRVLDGDPDNLDVRTDMATAYLHTGNPMSGVSEIKRVLEADPDHLNATFNYGLMLTWINRHEQAIVQFERVMALADSTSDHFRKALEAVEAIRAQGGP